MKRFKLFNNIVGWVAFAIAAVTYLLTIEPTASFWDCGEFISSAFKLEVGHPPGAPFFMMTAHLLHFLHRMLRKLQLWSIPCRRCVAHSPFYSYFGLLHI